MDVKTPNLNLYLLKANQMQKEITINEALISLDALISKRVKSITQTEPPVSPQIGDLYVLGEEPRGEWAKFAEHIALFNNGWRYFPLQEGFFAWVEDQRKLLIYVDSEWHEVIWSKSSSNSINGQ